MADPHRLRKRLVPGRAAAEYCAAHQLETDMIYELRIYRCLPGRLPALLKRFETPRIKIWEKHGIKQAGFWTVLIGDGNHDLLLLPRLGVARRPREEVGDVPGRSGVDRSPRRERARRPHPRQHHELLMTPTAFSSVK